MGEPVTMPVVLFLPYPPPATLSTNARRRGKVWEQREDTEQVRAFCVLWIRQHYPDVMVDGRLRVAVDIEVAWPKGRRRYDVDALASLTKAHLDSLVLANILVSDGPDYVTRITYSQTKNADPSAAGVRITIQEVS